MMRSCLRAVPGILIVAASLLGKTAFSSSSAQQQPPVDPLTASIHTEDAQRFAQLFSATNGHPTAEQIQKEYLDNGSYGVSVFTPGRIVSASHLAAAVAANHADYANAIQNCLPHIQQYNSDLRSIYLAMHGLLPDESLPQIYIVFGADKSGGTGGPNAQVLGLEVLCKTSGGTPEGLRRTFRQVFAHETVHTFQNNSADASKSPLLAEVLKEGGADFIASIVTGETPEPERANWAAQRESLLWREFQKDLAATRPPANKEDPEGAKMARLRWVENYGHPPPGWPFEAGYWVGMRIWQCYYAASPDKHRAIRDVLDWNDPEVILQKSGYQGRACEAESERTSPKSPPASR